VDDLQAVIQEIRTAIFDLQDASSGVTLLRRRLDEAVAHFAGSALRTSVQFVGPLSVIDAAPADHAEAVVREAVSNAVRHADATMLTVSVKVEDDLIIEVIDNGRGIPAEVTGSGLTNLCKRAQEVGGSFVIDSHPTGVTVLRWSEPLP
jgi:two-component system, NarL family, sensor histidine kinase DevS